MNNMDLLKYFKDASSAIDRVMDKDLADVTEGLLSEVLRYAIFNGGKRIRPQLTVLVAQMLAPETGSVVGHENLLKLAIVFEYLHAASLLHDDVIDHSEKRRGKPTANAVWGVSPVILAGDFLHARAMSLAGTIGGRECVAIVGRATEAMVEAEFLQMSSAEKIDTSEEKYFRIVSGKTGALIASACEAGALLAGASEGPRQSVRTYGENLGLAFQIVDDLLDYLGDPDKTGKSVGNDLAEGKMTLPLIHTLSKADEQQTAFLLDLLAGKPDDRLGKAAEVTEIIRSCGGFDYARGKAESVIDQGLKGLGLFDGPPKQILTGLAGYVLSRDK